MGKKVLMKGNEAIGQAAIDAGCRYFFGYPITPQNELPHYLARMLPKVGGVFLQAESEMSSIHMVYGASAAGARVLTSSSSPGISLKQEGLSYIAAAELPCVVVNVMRGGPGLGGIQPSQSDYFQATKGGGHGDYRVIVLAPHSVQEMFDLTFEAFDIADRYRNPVMILADGTLGQMMEAVEFPEKKPHFVKKDWALTGAKGRKRNIINTLYLQPDDLEERNRHLQQKYRIIMAELSRAELYQTSDAEIVIVAYGIVGRICKTVVKNAREKGIAVGLLRPITLWPYPAKYFQQLTHVKAFLTVELSAGQMVEDVKLAVNNKAPVYFYGRTGGNIPCVEEILEQLENIETMLKQGSIRVK